MTKPNSGTDMNIAPLDHQTVGDRLGANMCPTQSRATRAEVSKPPAKRRVAGARKTLRASKPSADKERSQKQDFSVCFWGARGTLASNAEDTARYGGNTACVEVRLGKQSLILDAGSGLRVLGDKIMKRAAKARKKGKAVPPIHLFFSHCHYDHISGLPFFAPFFDPKAEVHLYSGHLEGPDKTKRMVTDYMAAPFFPVGPEVFSAKLAYHDFEPGDVLTPFEGVKLTTLSLDHHNGCVGYRVDFDGRSICYITDTTHVPGKPDQGILNLIHGSELMIYDATYTDEEFPQFWNFGHSTWEEGVRLAKAAGVKRYAIFHHRPSRCDDALDDIQAACRKVFPKSWAAREGQKIKV
ncbi:MAG: MBL fold metallo-hydrolase [Pseudomonadota bacterium]